MANLIVMKQRFGEGILLRMNERLADLCFWVEMVSE